MSTSTFFRLCVRAPRTFITPDGFRTDGFRDGPVAQVTAGERAARPQRVDGALEDHLAAGGAGAGTQVDDMVGNRNRLRLVLDDEDGVALVAQPQQQIVHALNVVRVQPDRRLVEDVGHVGERRPEVADHLGALRLTARQRAGRPVEAEIAESDLHERVERVRSDASSGATDGSFRPRTHSARSSDLHRARIGDVDPLIFEDAGGLVETRALALGTGGERDCALDERADMRLHRLDVL